MPLACRTCRLYTSPSRTNPLTFPPTPLPPSGPPTHPRHAQAAQYKDLIASLRSAEAQVSVPVFFVKALTGAAGTLAFAGPGGGGGGGGGGEMDPAALGGGATSLWTAHQHDSTQSLQSLGEGSVSASASTSAGGARATSPRVLQQMQARADARRCQAWKDLQVCRWGACNSRVRGCAWTSLTQCL